MYPSVRRNIRRIWLLVVAAVVSASLIPSAAHADPPGRLVYEIVVGSPGTKSQEWVGRLFDAAGDLIEAPAGQPVTTPLGDFVDRPCGAWHGCGMIRTDMADWMKTHNANVPMDLNPWAYRLYVDGEGSPAEVWTSTLLHDNIEVPVDGKSIDTPMGPFRAGNPEASGWERAGWLPASWVEPTPPPGQPG